MQSTERYLITYSVLEKDFGNIDIIKELWTNCAEEVAIETNIFISASIDRLIVISNPLLTCDYRNEINYEITCVRNSDIYYEKNAYVEALMKAFLLMKKALNNPFATIQKQEARFAFFEPMNKELLKYMECEEQICYRKMREEMDKKNARDENRREGNSGC